MNSTSLIISFFSNFCFPRHLLTVNFKLRSKIVTLALVSISSLVFAFKLLLKDTLLNFNSLVDIFTQDFPNQKKRFQINYIMVSTINSARLRIAFNLNDNQFIPSLSKIFKSANWFEREIWDMHGLFFTDHPDLRRILTDYGFEGHPLRKDFPVVGFLQTRFDEELLSVVYEPVRFTQGMRTFKFITPWNNNNINSR